MSDSDNKTRPVIFMTREEGNSVNRLHAYMDGRQGFKQPCKVDFERVRRVIERAAGCGARVCYHNGAAAFPCLPEERAPRQTYRERSDAGQRFGEQEGDSERSSSGFKEPQGPASVQPAFFAVEDSDHSLSVR